MHDRAGDPGARAVAVDGGLPADTDEAAASEARARYREHGVEAIEPDEAIFALLGPGERVLAVRHSAAIDRRLSSGRASAIESIRGDLYVTTSRLVLIGREVFAFDLADIEDSALAGETVLLLLHAGVGLALDVDRPRLLRVQIGTARAALVPRPQPASR
jgi:hypothetical protein